MARLQATAVVFGRRPDVVPDAVAVPPDLLAVSSTAVRRAVSRLRAVDAGRPAWRRELGGLVAGGRRGLPRGESPVPVGPARRGPSVEQPGHVVAVAHERLHPAVLHDEVHARRRARPAAPRGRTRGRCGRPPRGPRSGAGATWPPKWSERPKAMCSPSFSSSSSSPMGVRPNAAKHAETQLGQVAVGGLAREQRRLARRLRPAGQHLDGAVGLDAVQHDLGAELHREQAGGAARLALPLALVGHDVGLARRAGCRPRRGWRAGRRRRAPCGSAGRGAAAPRRPGGAARCRRPSARSSSALEHADAAVDLAVVEAQRRDHVGPEARAWWRRGSGTSGRRPSAARSPRTRSAR